MNDKEIADCADDKSANVTFTISAIVENGRLTPEQRRLVASIVSRSVTTLTLSLERVVDGRFDMEVAKVSSFAGHVELDAGKTTDL